MHEGRTTSSWSQLFLSTFMWILGIELRLTAILLQAPMATLKPCTETSINMCGDHQASMGSKPEIVAVSLGISKGSFATVVWV